MFWQYMGFLYPIGGFVAFFVPLIVCTEPDPDNPLVDEAFDENDRKGVGMSMAEKSKLEKSKKLEETKNPTIATKKSVELANRSGRVHTEEEFPDDGDKSATIGNMDSQIKN